MIKKYGFLKSTAVFCSTFRCWLYIHYWHYIYIMWRRPVRCPSVVESIIFTQRCRVRSSLFCI